MFLDVMLGWEERNFRMKCFGIVMIVTLWVGGWVMFLILEYLNYESLGILNIVNKIVLYRKARLILENLQRD